MLKPSLPTLVDICIECDDQIGDDDGDGLSYALVTFVQIERGRGLLWNLWP